MAAVSWDRRQPARDDSQVKAMFTPQRSHWPIRVDLRSDTVTCPTEAMRRAICDAPVGDEQLGEDPSVNQLVETVADLLGKPAAVFLPSGTMCNEIALALHCRPGDEFYCDRTAHPLHAEAGGPAVLAGAQARAIDGKRGIYTAAELAGALSPVSRYAPEARLVWVEQTANLAGGTIWRADDIEAVIDVAKQNGLLSHLDGARLFNATVVTGQRPSAVAAPFDSVWVDFSKGLGAPVGAALAGDEDFIDGAWRWKQRLGGSMRQAGVLAAAASYALAHHVERLAEDHVRARRLADALSEIDGVELDPAQVETNIVIFSVGVGGQGGAAAFLSLLLEKHGVRGSMAGPGRVRFVTHLDIDDTDIDIAVMAVSDVMKELGRLEPA
jgi:threonine aldolase